VIPPAALERGERAFVAVLRRRYPDASFLVRDRAVSPEDPNVPGEIGAGATADLGAFDEPGQNIAALKRRKATPKSRERSSDGNPGQAGR
jgi:hypothetical protein